MLAKKRHTAHDFELNLTPIIDCFVTLICFLLLSATYVNLVSLDAKVPIAVSTTSVEKKEPTEKFKLEMTAKKDGIELVVTGAGSLSGKKYFKSGENDFDFKSVHQELVKLKRAYPKEFSIYFTTDLEMDYEKLIRFMDTTRNLDPAEIKDNPIVMTDERNGKTVKVDVLFPDFVISNLAASATSESITQKTKKK